MIKRLGGITRGLAHGKAEEAGREAIKYNNMSGVYGRLGRRDEESTSRIYRRGEEESGSEAEEGAAE